MKRRRPALALLLALALSCGDALAATPLNEELFTTVRRPRPRPEITPQSAVFTSRSTLYAGRAADGSALATVERGEEGDELWLYPAAATASAPLPRLVLRGEARLAAPALSRDGRSLVVVDSRVDVKGDLWLFDLSRPDSEPRRLTGPDFEEGGPAFSRDDALYYHRLRPGRTEREIVRLNPATGHSEVIPLDGDAAFPALASDGRLAFVSRRDDPGGDLWLRAADGALQRLTSGPERDLYPAWNDDGSLLFTRFPPPVTGGENTVSNGEILRLDLQHRRDGAPLLAPLTSAALGGVAPLPAGDEFLFISGTDGGGQLLTLPADGEIPRRPDLAGQWELAQSLLQRQPPDPQHARLACARVVALEDAPTAEGALAALALAELRETAGESAAAEADYTTAAQRYRTFPPAAPLAEIAAIRLRSARRCNEVVLAQRRQEVIRTALTEMERAAEGGGGDGRARALIDGARLLDDFGASAQERLQAVSRYDEAAALPTASRALRAEAACRRALLLSRIEQGEGGRAALIAVIRDWEDQERWAEAAAAALLDQLAPAGAPTAESQRRLAEVAERYRRELPRLAMGGWNRIGDLAYRDQEWARAKDAYRTVLEQFPPLGAPTAAARFALAEILYREERYGEAIALYESEMAQQPEEHPLYQLARNAYLRKSLAAGENLYRLGELAAARATFLGLIRYDDRILEAHRGYIKAVAAQGQAAELLALYRKELERRTDDPVLLYAAGLCESYLPGESHLRSADRMIERAAARLPRSEYPPQTRGYLAEVGETVYGERGGLERALELYRRAWLLNRGGENPENRANLDLNIGNVAFLLGRNATAREHYQRRRDAALPFDNPETELLFHRRYAAVAFQLREREAPIAGYGKALELTRQRLDPARPLDDFGRLTRRTIERLFTPAPTSVAGDRALAEAQEISAALDRLGATPPQAPPSAGWDDFAATLRTLLQRQRNLIAGATAWNREGSARHGVELTALAQRVERSLDDVPRLVETTAELHDRLGLACLEADNFPAAREHFTAAYDLNRALGHTENLVANRRSAGVAAWRGAQEASGAQRLEWLLLARDDFRTVLELLELYPPGRKQSASRGGGLLQLDAEVALDRQGGTAAAFGFSAAQERRLAETLLARIASELGAPQQAAELLRRQLAAYPAADGELSVGDRYGVSLLLHRAAQSDYAAGNHAAAQEEFRRSTRLCLLQGNPVSAMLNLVNWGSLLTTATPEPAEVDDFLGRLAETTTLAAGYRTTLPPQTRGRFHNDSAVLLARLAAQADDPAAATALRYRALDQLALALRALPETPAGGERRAVLQLRSAALLNRGELLDRLGLPQAATDAFNQALALAASADLPRMEWRALAALGRYAEALKLLAGLAPGDWDLTQGEAAQRFAPWLAEQAGKNAEVAFALLEQLAELERVQLLGRSALSLNDPAVAARLTAAAPHLAEIDRLRQTLSRGEAKEADYLKLRLQQEETLLATQLGSDLATLPPFYAADNGDGLRFAAAAADLANATAEAADQGATETARLRAARERQRAVAAVLTKGCRSGNGRLCGLLVPQPVEAIDVLERLAGRTLLRFTPLDNDRFLLFTLGGKEEITATVIDRAELERRLGATPGLLAACERPGDFPTTAVAAWGLSATQLLRALEQRKPFRRQVLAPAGVWPAGAPFTLLPESAWEKGLSDAHLLILPGRGGLLPIAPDRAGRGGTREALWEDRSGTRRPFRDLTTAESLALLIAPRSGGDDLYSLGHLAAWAGIPTVLAGGDGALPPAFSTRYATAAVATAKEELPPGWVLLGDPGLDAVAAARLGKERFVDLGKRGVTAHNERRYPQALALFENALAIARENPELAKQITPLHRYARESAFAAGATDRALDHGRALAQGLAKEKPYSADHADALLRLGLLLGRAERFAEATAPLQEAVEIFAELGLTERQAAALADFGLVMENAVDYPAARSRFEEALGLRRTLQDELPLAEQYRNLGRLYDLRLNQYAAAERYYAQAGEIYRRSGKTVLEAETLLERGRTKRLLGNFPAADALYAEALTKVGPGDERTRLRIVLEQANNAWFQGRYQEAFDRRDEVEQGAVRHNWPLEAEMAKNTGGLIWWTLGNHPRALLELRTALQQAEQLEGRRDEVATTLNNIGLVQRESGDYPAALRTLEQALAIDRKLGSRWAIAYDLRNLGQTRLRMGEAAAARPLLAEAATLATEIGDQVNLAKILLAQGDAARQLNQSSVAEASYRRALELSEAMLLREVRWRALFGLAQLQRQRGEAEAAVASYRLALDTIEGLRAEIRLDQLKDGFLADKQAVYTGLVGLLVDLQRPDEAFSVAERSRARNLLDILGRQKLSLAGSVDRELYDRQLQLKEQLVEQETLAAQAATPAERTMYAAALQQLRADYQDLLLEIERQRPELLALVKVEPLTLDSIRALLAPGVALLSYYQLPDRLLCWRIERERATLHLLPVAGADLAAKIDRYRRMLQNLEPLDAASRELHTLLVAGPLADSSGITTVGIIPHGALHYLAFATLSDGRDYLIDRQPLFYLPAASVLRYTLSRRQAEKNLKVLAIGNPDLGNRSLDLPFAEREAGTLRWNYREVTLLTRERATESWVREHSADFGIIHLASHGEFDPVNPLFSAVRLTRDSREDGRLEAEEIFGLDLNADLVVLSACQTGLGEIRSGDDVVGMNRAFLYAGTHALLSSLWRVSDVSTAILMKQFYREYRQQEKAASLRRAMLHVKNRYPHPGYWGAFVLSGDYE